MSKFRIPFTRPCNLGAEIENLRAVLNSPKWASDGRYSAYCSMWLERTHHTKRVLLTTSCTDALEMSALLLDLKPGDEVILPSFTFVSSASAFALRGALLKFIDVRPDTMNLDENLIESAVTPRTRAICVVHYAGVGCEMDRVLEIAKTHRIAVIEDAAQGIMASYKGRPLGSIGDAGTLSFHDTKNISSGEGGALLVNREDWISTAEVIRDKGTNRSEFIRGEVDKYTWRTLGSSFAMSDLNAAILAAQLDRAEKVKGHRLAVWKLYQSELSRFQESERIELTQIPEHCDFNGHIFYLKLKDTTDRQALMTTLSERGIVAATHYVPLHSSLGGKLYGEFMGEDRYTTRDSERLLRLPLYNSMSLEEAQEVCEVVYRYLSR